MAAYRSLIYGLIIDYNGGGGLQDGRGASELLPLRKKKHLHKSRLSSAAAN